MGRAPATSRCNSETATPPRISSTRIAAVSVADRKTLS